MEGFREKVAAGLAGLQDVDVNVKPDTTGFREKVRAAVTGIGSMDVPVSPNVDTTRANAQVGAFATELRAKLEAATKALGDIHMTADSTEVERKIAAIRAQLATLRDQRIGVDIDAGDAQAKIAALEAELAALGARSPNIQVKVDVDAARANLRALMADGDSLIAKFSNANLGSTMFAALGAAIPPLLTSIGQLSGALGLLPGALAGVGTAIGAVVVGSQGLGEAFKAQAAAEEAATAAGGKNVAALQQQVTAGAAHIASLKAQQAAGQNVTAQLQAAETAQKANVSALNDAKGATDKAKTAADAYAASLQNLAPSAREFVSAVVQLKPAFEQLRLDVQQQLFKGIGDQLLQLGNSALPTIRNGLSSMASAINIVISRVLEFIGQQSSIQSWQNIFQNLSTAAGNLASAVKPVLQIITDVTEVGSQLLPGLARGFADAAQRAADFVSKAKDTGQLRQWIQTGIDAVKQLWQSFKDVVAIIADLAASPGFGPSFLDALNAVTGSIRWFIENVPGATTLVKLFFDTWLFAKIVQGLTNMATTIKTVATAIGGAVTKVKEFGTASTVAGAESEAAARKAGSAWRTVGLAIGAIVAGEALKAVGKPGEGPFGDLSTIDKFRDAADTAGKLLTLDFSGVFDKLKRDWNNLPNDLQTAGQRLTSLATQIAIQMQAAWSGLSGFFSGLWSGITSAAQGAWSGIAGAVTGAISGIQSAWGALTGFFSGLWSGIVSGLQSAWAGVSGFFSGLWQGIVGAAQAAWQGLVGFLSGIPGQIQAAWGVISGFFSGLWSGIVAAAQGAWQGLVGFISGLPGQIQGAWSAISGFFSGLWQGIVSQAQGIWQSLVGIVQSVAQQIVGAFQAIPGQMAQIGQAIVQGIGQAIQAGWSWLTNLVSQLAQQLFQAAKAALGIASPSKRFAYVGRNIGLGLAQGINDSRAEAERAMAALNAAIGPSHTEMSPQRGGMAPSWDGGDRRWRGGRDERAWDWLEELLRRWRGGHGGGAGGGSGAPKVAGTIGTSVLQRATSSLAFGGTGGTASYMRTVKAPMTQVLQPAPSVPSPPSRGGRGGRGGDRTVYVDSNSALVQEVLRLIRVEVRKNGGDVQVALGR